ncbi:MAG: IS4 family transposase [Myxococcota bacterium]
MQALSFGPVSDEFEGAELGDDRLGSRLVRIVRALERDPASGFPRAMGSDADLEGFYRFINNPRFNEEEILAPHVERTFARAEGMSEVLAIHDSSFFQSAKKAPREQARIASKVGARGFMAHVALVTTLEGMPLGLGYLETLVRTGTRASKPKRLSDEKMTARWLRSVAAVDEHCSAIHIIDAEGDFFELLEAMREAESRFVIRAGHLQRIVESDDVRGNLHGVIETLSPSVFRTIELGERRYVERLRGPRSRRSHPQRNAREARVAMSGMRVRLRPRSSTPSSGVELAVNVVRVWEPEPPRGQDRIEWVLLTNEDIERPGALERVVDLYRKRWLIEEYFKALETGCSLEKRQVESFSALKKVLALLAPVACRLLLLRALHRQAANAPPDEGFDEIDLNLLVRAQRRPTPWPKTLEQAYLLLARLGGHIRNNGAPGWQTLAAGYETLLILRVGWIIARQFA